MALASRDSDLEQLLSDRVSLLSALLMPPYASLLTAAAFVEQRAFPPETLPLFMALVGKPQAGIGGMGVGAKPAGKILARCAVYSRLLGMLIAVCIRHRTLSSVAL